MLLSLAAQKYEELDEKLDEFYKLDYEGLVWLLLLLTS